MEIIATAIYHFTAFRILIILSATIILQIVLSIAIDKIVHRVINSHRHVTEVEKQKRIKTLERVFKNFSHIIIWLIAIIVILAELKVNLAALLTGAGLIGVVAGIAAQNVIKNYLSGIFIILENQYRVGDIIMLTSLGSTNGTSGVVEDISIRTTRLRDIDGSLHIITNGTATVITNLTHQFSSALIKVNVSYDADIDKVEKIINKVGMDLQKDKKWQQSIIDPITFLRLDSFNDSSITVMAVGKVKPGDQWAIEGDFRRRVKKEFDRNGVEMPFPQIVLHDAKTNNNTD